MKKLFSAFLFISLLLLAACQSEQIKLTQGHIKEMTDTSIVVVIDNYDITFITKQAKYDNGAVMPGDSVAIHYVGDLREKHAVAALIKLIPPQGTIVEAGFDPTKELKTAPMNEEDAKKFDKFIEHEKARRAAKGAK